MHALRLKIKIVSKVKNYGAGDARNANGNPGIAGFLFREQATRQLRQYEFC